MFVDLADHIDIEAEIARSEKEIEKLREQITSKNNKLANENFIQRALADVVAKERDSLQVLEQRLESAVAALVELRRG